jgi:hypothetical protein
MVKESFHKVNHVKRSYEQDIVEIMVEYKVTLLEALMIDMQGNGVDTDSVLDLTDYLEVKFDQDMDKVEYYMDIISGRKPDLFLKPL